MALVVHRATRADALADGLADLLASPLDDPFAEELVLVPAKGVERWLSQRLSHRLGTAPGRDDGVCAGVSLRNPAGLVAELLGTRDDDPWAPDALVWPLLEVVDESAGEAWARPLALHVGHDPGASGEEAELRRGRRYAVARRLARLLASYAAQRPGLLEAWEAGSDDGVEPDLSWQPELWRRVVARVGGPSPVERHRAVCASLRRGELPAAVPARLSLFGHTRLPVTEVELLAALGAQRDVHLWLPHPSPALWDTLADLRGGVVPRDADDAAERVRHPLLASLGRDVRELQRLLQDAPHLDAGVLDSAAAGPTLLARLQHNLAHDAEPRVAALDPGDRSVQVHACHGPARQVEVLREVVLGLLADDETLEPRDVVVMCPDIEAYAPLVAAAFGMGEVGTHPGHRLRLRLADRSLTQTNPLLGVLAQLLDLAGGRAEASRVLDLLDAAPVRRRFGLGDDDLETVAAWVREAGVRWAFDADHRAEFGLGDYVQNTWRFGLDRVLAGVAVSDDADRFYGTTLPLDDVGSTSIDLAGRLAEALERLQAVTDALGGARPVEHWLATLAEAVGSLTAPARGEEWQTAQVHRELAATLRASAGTTAELRLPDVRALMRERLAGRPTRANFRTGTLTVCTLTPMRSVPHRVVCLLGLDDGVFPRAATVDGDDALARRPVTGERDPRSEDRQLLLDSLLAATDHLVVTYTGADETTGRPRPPAVPLGELLDTVAAMGDGALERVVRHHPLQAFDARNFDPVDPALFDPAALAAARAAVRPRRPAAALAEVRLPDRAGDVELDDLVRFLRHPVRAFLRDRLEVASPQDADEVADGLPVELDHLVQWQVGERLLADLVAGDEDPAVRGRRALDKEWRRGVLPPGRLGWQCARGLLDQAEPVAELVRAFRQGEAATAADVDVDLGGGRRLRGTVTDLFGTRVVRHSYSKLGPRHHLDAWVPLLALCATRPGRGWSAGTVGRGRGRGQATARAAFGPVDDATERLRDLVALYDAGMRGPLPMPLKTAHAWATQRPAARRSRAGQEWDGGRFDGERDDEAHVRVWGPKAPLDVLLGPPEPGEATGDGADEPTRLGALAVRLWTPILERARG